MIEAMIQAMIDPLPPFTFCCPQAIVDEDAGVSTPNISLLPLDEVPVHVHRFAARAPCDSKGSECQCGMPRPCEVGRPKGRRRKNRRQSHKFFLAPAALCTPHPLDGCTPGCTDDSIFRVTLAGTRKSLRFPHFFNNLKSY